MLFIWKKYDIMTVRYYQVTSTCFESIPLNLVCFRVLNSFVLMGRKNLKKGSALNARNCKMV